MYGKLKNIKRGIFSNEKQKTTLDYSYRIRC